MEDEPLEGPLSGDRVLGGKSLDRVGHAPPPRAMPGDQVELLFAPTEPIVPEATARDD
jgi:hypothetical protein